MTYDFIILTEDRYWKPKTHNTYIENLLLEDQMLMDELQSLGLHCSRLPWSHPSFDWSDTRSVIFRTTWDYFDRFDEFSTWLDQVARQTHLINHEELIRWNIDKHYLRELEKQQIPIPKTQFIEKGDSTPLADWQSRSGFNPFILKPAVSGAGRHTYKLNKQTLREKEDLYHKLIQKESFLIQEFLPSVEEKGEVSFMLIDGRFTHAVLKKAKAGDFRVQDDFGGTVKTYSPNTSEKKWAENIFSNLQPKPLYGRVDAMWDNTGQLCVSELELIEPELWFRFHPQAAKLLALACKNEIEQL